MSNNDLQALPPTWKHATLHRRIIKTIETLPEHFKPSTHIEGLHADDIPQLGKALANTIEAHTVDTLNAMRVVWDPENQYATFSFIRHPQMFPGVRLCRIPGSNDIIMGIELSNWYVLAKEGAPNFRFLRAEAACADQDLLIVVPWALSDVTHGTPIAFLPYIASAKRVVTARNNYWMHDRRTDGDRTIESPVGIRPYPTTTKGIDDKPVGDGSDNFGRIARTGLMDAYFAETKKIVLRERHIAAWIADAASTRANRGDVTPAPAPVS